MARKRSRGLSEEDRQLWNKVAATTNPRARTAGFGTAHGVHSKIDTASAPEPPASREPEFRLSPFTLGDTAQPKSERQTAPHPPLKMDQSVHKRLIRGKLKPEARLDLHGMTLAEAHPALIGFIVQSHASARRLVLVITGKGKGDDGIGLMFEHRGALRRQVPHWLAAPPLNALILETRLAHRKHGGEGAIYVYLKRRR